MQELTTMFGSDGEIYDLPEDKVEAFREKRGGEAAQNFRLPDGREYSIPESKHDRFMEVHPDAVPLRALSFENGQKRMMSNGDVSKFLRSPEYRDGEEFAADREALRQASDEPKRSKWVDGDGGEATLPEGEANEWGGNLRKEGRRVLLRRDDSGKVNGYSTTSSMLVKENDGTFAVIPTVVNGEELTPDEAVAHYAKTGEHWGRAKDEESAREMAKSVHEKHAELNQQAWNDYLHDNWDDVSDEIRNDEGMAREHELRASKTRATNPAIEFAKELGRSWWKNLTFQPGTPWREWMDSGSTAADMVKNANAFAGKMAKGAAEMAPAVNSIAGRAVGGRGTAVGRALMDAADAQRAAIDRSINTDTPDMGDTMNAANDFVQNTLVTVGKLANPHVAATVIAFDSADAADRARDEALANGASVQKAEALGTAMGMLEAAKGIYLSNSAGGKLLQKPAVQKMMQSFMGKVLGLGGKAAITGGEMAVLGGATDIVQQGVEGAENPDLERTGKVTLKEFATGAAFDLVASGVHGTQRAMFHTPPPEGAPVGYVRDLLEKPEGRQLVMSANPNVARKMIEARFNGEPITQEMLASLKLPEAVAPTEAERNAIGDAMLSDYRAVRDRQMAQGPSREAVDAAAARSERQEPPTTTQQEKSTSETRANEAPAQPEQGEVVAPAQGEAARPVEGADAPREAPDARVVAPPAVWPNGWDNAGEEIKGYVVPNDGDVAPGREVAIAHRSGGSINAPQKIKGVVESVDGDTVKVYHKDGWGYDHHDTFKKSELVGVMPLTAVPTEGATPQTAENRAEAAQEAVGARRAAETGKTTPAASEGVEAPSRAPDAQGGNAAPVVEKKTRRGANLRGLSYEDYGKETGDAVGASLLRHAKENGGLLSIPANGSPDPMADWIADFLNGNSRKNRRGDYIALFGMTPRRGGNDAMTEDMPDDLKAVVDGMIEKRGPEAVADWFLDVRRKYAEWAASARDRRRQERGLPDGVSLDEIEAREQADAEYDNALAEVERYEAGSPTVQNFSSAQMRELKRGDVLRFDHADTSWDVVGYDAGSNVVTLVPQGALDNPLMDAGEVAANMVKYRVSENGFEEVRDGRETERGASENLAGDAQGSSVRAGAGEEGKGGFALESVSAEEIKAEEKRRREKAEIRRRQSAPLKGGTGEVGQSLMDLGGAEGEDLFNRVDRSQTAPLAKPDVKAKPTEKESRGPGRPAKSDEQRAAETAEKIRPILDFARNDDGTFNPDALRNQKGNGGLPLKELKLLHEHPEAIDSLGLPAEDAAALRSAVDEAYATQSATMPNARINKTSEAGTFNYSVKAGKALEELKANPDDIKALAKAQLYVQRALESEEVRSEGSTNKQNRDFWQKQLDAIDKSVASLTDADAQKFANAVKDEEASPSLESRNESGGTALNVSENKKALKPINTEPNKGRRGIQLETKNGVMNVVWRNDMGEVVRRAPLDMLEKAAQKDPAIKDLIEKLKSGEQIKASKVLDDILATDAPQSWTPETQKPLEHVARALRNVVTVGGKKVKVEFLNERPEFDGPNAFKNSEGVTVGEYDAAKGEIRLYPGAKVADVVHEFTHPLVDFARAEAKAGRGELLGKINQIINAERETWEEPVRDAYKGKSNETILEEIFTHAMGEKGADLFGKSTKTLQGRRWYNRLWEAIKGVWQDFATKMGWNKADLRGLERMSPEDAAQKILSEMAKGRNFGDAVTGGEGTRNAAAMAKFSSGRDYVHVDTDQNLFDGKPKNTFPKIAHDAIINKFRGKVIGDAPQNAYVKTDTAGEYAYGGKPLDDISKEAKMRSSPELDNILRAVPKDVKAAQLQSGGEWVSPSKTYAENHGKSRFGEGNYKIIREDVRPEHLWWDANDAREWGYDDGRQYVYVNAPGGSKLATVTYDDAGNVIPLSQRFNPQREDIRYSRRVVPPPAPTTKDIADWLDGKDDVRRKWRRALQDKNIGIRDIEEKLGITDKNESAYYAKDRAFGKNEHELTVLQKQEVEPIVEKIHKSGGDLGLFSAYLYARHAGERNAVLKAEKGVDNGSGMNDAQAKTIFDAVDRLGLRAAFEDAAKDVWAMNRKYLQRRVDSGRMTQAEADFLMKRYQHYVPLRTDMTNEELDIFNSTTSGWKRNETMTAEGRKSAADDPLAFSIVQNEQAIRASNANEVRKRWAGVVRRAKGGLGEIVDGVNKGTAKWTFTFGDGETVETGSPMKLASERDDIILFKENGQLKAIKMKPGEHGRGLDLARAVTDKDVAKFNEHLDWIPRATRWMSAMRTQYVPTFIVRNLKADNLEVMLNALSERGLRGENGKSGGVAFFGKFLKNEVGVAKGVREYFKTGKSSDRYVQEAVENGLLTGGGMAAEGFTETARRLSDTLQALRERPKILGGTLKAAKDTISLLNACAEYNTRMGVYKTLREEGMSVADAVSYARDVTVNFNRKGYITPYTNAAFMFSNAAVQGMGRAFKSMGSEHGKGVLAGLFMVGVAQALLDDWLGHDDEKAKSGGADSRNMTEYDKEHSLGVALPTGHRVKTGIRNPWALPMYAGRKTVELLKGITSGEQAMKDLANAIGNFVTEPVGGNGFGSKAEVYQTIMPTIIDPLVQWSTGKDYRGQDRLKKSFDKTAPQSWNGKERTPEAYKLIAQGLNALTGGNEFRKGWVDSAPEDWQLLTETVFGGVLTDLNNVVKAGGHAVDIARGKPAAQIARDIPFVRDTFTNLPENSNRYYAALEDYERDKAEFKKTTPERRKEMKSEKPYLFTGKSTLDGQIERVKEYMHRERGEVKAGRRWVEPKTSVSDEAKEAWRKKRLALQARILERLGN